MTRLARWLAGSTLVLALAAPALAGDGDPERPAPPAAPGQDAPAPPRSVEDLIGDLAGDDYRAREAATEGLAARGAEALPALRKAARGDDPEVRWRAEKAIAAIEARGGRALGAAETPAGQPRPPEAAPAPGAAPRPPGEWGPLPPRIREDLERERRRFPPEMDRFIEELARSGFPPELAEHLRRQFGEMEERLREFGVEPMPVPPLPRERRLPIPPLVPPVPDPRDRDEDAPGFEFRVYRLKDGEWVLETPRPRAERRVGARCEPVPPALRESLGLGEVPGLYVEDVQPGSVAERAGLRRHDIVRSIDGIPAGAAKDLSRLLAPGEHRIEVIRGGERIELDVGAPPPKPPPPPPPPPSAPERKSY